MTRDLVPAGIESPAAELPRKRQRICLDGTSQSLSAASTSGPPLSLNPASCRAERAGRTQDQATTGDFSVLGESTHEQSGSRRHQSGIGRQASWPSAFSPAGALQAKARPQLPAGLCSSAGSFRTPSNHTGPAPPHAPQLSRSCTSLSVAGKAAQQLSTTSLHAERQNSDALHHQQTKKAVYLAAEPSAAATFGSTESSRTSLQLSAAPHRRLHSDDVHTVQPQSAEAITCAANASSLHPKQRAQLHALCTHLLSKTLELDISPHRPTLQTQAAQLSAKIPAHYGTLSAHKTIAARSASRQLQLHDKSALPGTTPVVCGPAALAMHWAVALSLHQPDSVYLCMHLWKRLHDKVCLGTACCMSNLRGLRS